jgi:peptidoglycan/xylan/chitin deacetylase (PgdA/CDA1 family)
VFFTMDCERVIDRDLSAHGIWGPPDWAFSERTIRRFGEILREEKMIGTFFITPDTATAHRPLWPALVQEGHELGLHVHPQGMGDLEQMRWNRFFGEYAGAERMALLGEAADTWRLAVGHRPLVFRPGNFSGSAGMFGDLAAAGFVAGSVSLPGRLRPLYHAKWRDMRREPAFLPAGANPANAFLELPITAELSTTPDPDGQWNPMHLRVESEALDENAARRIIRENLGHMRPKGSLPRSIVVLTHNTHDYADSGLESRLRCILRVARGEIHRAGGRIRNTSMERLRDELVGCHG